MYDASWFTFLLLVAYFYLKLHTMILFSSFLIRCYFNIVYRWPNERKNGNVFIPYLHNIKKEIGETQTVILIILQIFTPTHFSSHRLVICNA